MVQVVMFERSRVQGPTGDTEFWQHRTAICKGIYRMVDVNGLVVGDQLKTHIARCALCTGVKRALPFPSHYLAIYGGSSALMSSPVHDLYSYLGIINLGPFFA